MKSLGLYIHIPFCQKKCNYCDFYSKEVNDEAFKSKYIDALCLQIEREAEQYKNHIVDTIFFGGGTPSLIKSKDMEKLMLCIKKCLRVDENAEISIEINPKTVDYEKLKAYKKIGINRISIGLQSTDDEMLKCLGRIHSYNDFLSTYKLVREAGFDNVSVDLMYGLPNQTVTMLQDTLSKILCLDIEHISLYLLKIEEKTYFGKIKNRLYLPDDDTEYEMYIKMCELLEENGYSQYEISNFSKEGKRSRHNLKYWLSDEYIGLGPNAHSYFEKRRFSYKADTTAYINELLNGGLPEKISEEQIECISEIDEYVMLKLRLSDGIELCQFKNRFDIELTDKYPSIMKYVKSGHMKLENGKCYFTRQGFFVSNYILSDIL